MVEQKVVSRHKQASGGQQKQKSIRGARQQVQQQLGQEELGSKAMQNLAWRQDNGNDAAIGCAGKRLGGAAFGWAGKRLGGTAFGWV
jgi:hypothetical protein